MIFQVPRSEHIYQYFRRTNDKRRANVQPGLHMTRKLIIEYAIALLRSLAVGRADSSEIT
jgi:hypothetical protein